MSQNSTRTHGQIGGIGGGKTVLGPKTLWNKILWVTRNEKGVFLFSKEDNVRSDVKTIAEGNEKKKPGDINHWGGVGVSRGKKGRVVKPCQNCPLHNRQVNATDTERPVSKGKKWAILYGIVSNQWKFLMRGQNKKKGWDNKVEQNGQKTFAGKARSFTEQGKKKHASCAISTKVAGK